MSDETRSDDAILELERYNRPPPFPRASLQVAVFDRLPAARRPESGQWLRYVRGAGAIAAGVMLFWGGVLVERAGLGRHENRIAVSGNPGPPTVQPVSTKVPGDAPHRVIWL